jgi:membrane-associated phospholipid phosphatase
MADGLPLATWRWFTPLGDAVLVLPLVACAAALLAWHHRDARRPALRWLLIVALACAMAAASKIAFYGWGTGVPAWNLTCFSGHAVVAMVSWPVLGALLAPRRWQGARQAMCLGGIVLALLIGWSRVRIGGHSMSEVIAGAGLGGLGAWLALRGLRMHTIDLSRRAVLVPVAIVLVAITTAPPVRLPTEGLLARIGTTLSDAPAPVSRKAWREEHGYKYIRMENR